jgi:hypothetical protein
MPLSTIVTVKSNDITESQPFEAPLLIVKVGVFVELVYVFPSIHVNGPHADCTSVAVTALLMVKLKFTRESHPFAAGSVKE